MPKYVVMGFFLVVLGCPLCLRAETKEPPFSPVWKLMSERDKEQFVAGYLRGWQEASGVASIVLDHVHQNPAEATRGLEKLKDVLAAPQVPAAANLIQAINAHYADPQNAGDSLYMALNASKR